MEKVQTKIPFPADKTKNVLILIMIWEKIWTIFKLDAISDNLQELNVWVLSVLLLGTFVYVL